MAAAGEHDLRCWSAPLRRCLPVVVLALSPVALAQPVLAQTSADFYRGKSLELDIGSSVGGGYDAYARVPLVIDLSGRDEGRAVLELVFARQVMAWPYLVPPGVPPDRADALRRAFMQTMNDADFLADAEKSRLEVRPVAGEDVEKLVRRVYGTPAAIAERAASLLK
jgi:hypothetical protein